MTLARPLPRSWRKRPKLASIDTTLYRIPLPVPIQAASTAVMSGWRSVRGIKIWRRLYEDGEVYEEYQYYTQGRRKVKHGWYGINPEYPSERTLGNYKDGVKEGFWEYYLTDTNILLAEGHFVNGKKEGEWIGYHDSNDGGHRSFRVSRLKWVS